MAAPAVRSSFFSSCSPAHAAQISSVWPSQHAASQMARARLCTPTRAPHEPLASAALHRALPQLPIRVRAELLIPIRAPAD
ncbi:hypothetical protein CHLRE_03g157426v5 [Chlamydomonas reinhardtii]|uniref:Uncharacterized protein n=1 Tax=Chlamydomonas reinhardtii TaxID=3055 RepID=A0A2K3DW45_CHLRE|nr:uncharacterized protein CHLRE_03g157426v5 [Chlamydomonas reinhardtii]PNW84754.1 hypothetical protein CHLRE_03g157426v5 [Chlamydomonas reinhardtii]